MIKPIKNKDKYNKKKIAAEAAVASAIANGQPPPPLPPKKKKKNKKGGVLDQMRTKLQGGQFRWLNEQLYTSAGEKALELMNKSPELYEKYHEGMFVCWLLFIFYLLRLTNGGYNVICRV